MSHPWTSFGPPNLGIYLPLNIKSLLWSPSVFVCTCDAILVCVRVTFGEKPRFKGQKGGNLSRCMCLYEPSHETREVGRERSASFVHGKVGFSNPAGSSTHCSERPLGEASYERMRS